MVKVFESSFKGYGYRETNQQLVKENVELKQQLSQVISENSQQKEDILQKDIEIFDLKRKIADLDSIRQKYNSIKDIILDKKTIETNRTRTLEIEDVSHRRSQFTRQSVILPLPGPSAQSSNASISGEYADTKDHLDEEEEDEEVDEEEGENEIEDNTDEQEDQTSPNILQRISELNEDEISPSPQKLTSSYNDSLDPPDVTSVPPLVPERIIHTPSVWNCLDTDETPISSYQEDTTLTNLKLPSNIDSTSPIRPVGRNFNTNVNINDMYQSTPVHYPKPSATRLFETFANATADNQENLLATTQTKTGLIVQEKPKATRGRKRAAKIDPSVPSVVAPVDQDANPKRYNLRKRSKV